ncbi:MAG TPA: FapA family protein, partial [Phycisphaerae bacterium]|nr:FapA family protein [Phycisphaerae bacterium]
ASFDNRSCRIHTVKSGEVIGEYVPETPPQPGMDVYGKPIPGAPSLLRFELGANVKLADDGKTVYATSNGMVRVTRQGVSVVEQVKVDGDVDLKSGNVDAPSDVLITGNVVETFLVRSPKSITIKGMVEAANVEAGSHVIIAGGVAGKSKALIRAGGELQVKFLEEAAIEATGDVIVTKEVMNCRIRTMGRLLVPRGPIIGGSVYARQGVEVLALGNDVDVPTQVAVGVFPPALLEVAKMSDIIKKKREAATKVRNTVQPLLAQLKRLNPQQREKATELMYEADRLEEEANALNAKKDEILRPFIPSGDREVSILVNRMVNCRVSIVFGDKVATILKPRRGPVKFVSRVVDRVESILMVDAVSGSTQILPSQPYEPEPSATEADTKSPGNNENEPAASQKATRPVAPAQP